MRTLSQQQSARMARTEVDSLAQMEKMSADKVAGQGQGLAILPRPFRRLVLPIYFLFPLYICDFFLLFSIAVGVVMAPVCFYRYTML